MYTLYVFDVSAGEKKKSAILGWKKERKKERKRACML